MSCLTVRVVGEIADSSTRTWCVCSSVSARVPSESSIRRTGCPLDCSRRGFAGQLLVLHGPLLRLMQPQLGQVVKPSNSGSGGRSSSMKGTLIVITCFP